MAQHRPDAKSPLLPAAGSDKPDDGAKRNKYPFYCAVLASMTPHLTGYNCRRGGDERRANLHGGGLGTERWADRGAVGGHQHLRDRRCAAGGLDIGPPRPAPHHRARQRLLPRGLARHGRRRRVRRAHGRAVRRWRRRRVRLVITPVYAAEIAPASSRGLITSLSEIFLSFGVTLSYVSNFVFSGLPVHLSWRVMFAAGAAPTVFLAAGVLTMPESPRWLTMKGRLVEAKAVLAKTSDTQAEAEQRLLKIEDVVKGTEGEGGGGAWSELATKPGVRRVLAIVLTLQFFQQASGINSVELYGPRVLATAGVTSRTLLLGLNALFGMVKVGSILIATALSDRVGRRPLLLVSTGGMTASLLVLGSLFAAFAGAKDDAAVVAVSVAAVVAFLAVFSVGLGPLAWVYSSEILPLRLRGQGAGLGTATNRITSAVVIMTFISLYQAITMAGAFYLYAAAFLFIYTCLPETRGRSLEDMEELFHTK